MDYKETNRELTLKNQELLQFVSLLKEEIIKLNRSLLMEKENIVYLKGTIARILKETSDQVLHILYPKSIEIARSANINYKRRSSTSVLRENISINENRNSIITQTLPIQVENIRPRYSDIPENSSSPPKLFDNITCRPRRQNIAENCENVIETCGDDDDTNSCASDITDDSNIIPEDAEEVTQGDSDVDITYEENPTANSYEYNNRSLPTIIEEPATVLAEDTEFALCTITEEPSCIIEETDDIPNVSENENEELAVANDFSYNQLLLSKAISSTPFKRDKIDKNKSTFNVKVLVAKLKNDYLLKLGIDPQTVQIQPITRLNKIQAKIPKKQKKISKKDEEPEIFHRNNNLNQKETKSKKKTDNGRPKRKAAPTKLIERSVKIKLRKI